MKRAPILHTYKGDGQPSPYRLTGHSRPSEKRVHSQPISVGSRVGFALARQ